MNTKLHMWVAGAALAATLLSNGRAHGEVLYSTGFEPPTFSVGPIDGQPALGGGGRWRTPHLFLDVSTGQGIPQIENTVVKSGTQAFEVPASAASDLIDAGAYHVSTAPARALVDMSADIQIQISGAGTPFYQFGALGGTGVPGSDGFVGGIQITGQSIQALTGAGFPVIGTGFTPSVWHHVDVEFNFSTQHFSVLLDGALLGSDLSFCGGIFSCSGTLDIPAFGSGFFDAVITSPSIGYLDNFQVATIPEPSSWLMLVSGLVGMGFLVRPGSKRRFPNCAKSS